MARVRVARGLLVVGGIAAGIACQELEERAARVPPGVVGLEECTRCHQVVSDVHFAGRILAKDGEVLSFDDPGCLLSHLTGDFRREPDRIWFHHVHEKRWLSAAEVGFTRTAYSPMGYEFGAVDAGAAGAMSLEAALELVRLRGHP